MERERGLDNWGGKQTRERAAAAAIASTNKHNKHARAQRRRAVAAQAEDDVDERRELLRAAGAGQQVGDGEALFFVF